MNRPANRNEPQPPLEAIDPMTPTDLYTGYAEPFGKLGLHAAGPYLFILIQDPESPEEAPQTLTVTINWGQIRRITVNRIGWCSVKFAIQFVRGRLPETMVDLMLNDHRLDSVIKNGPAFLQELVQRGLLAKQNMIVNVHFVPTCPPAVMARMRRRPPPPSAGAPPPGLQQHHSHLIQHQQQHQPPPPGHYHQMPPHLMPLQPMLVHPHVPHVSPRHSMYSQDLNQHHQQQQNGGGGGGLLAHPPPAMSPWHTGVLVYPTAASQQARPSPQPSPSLRSGVPSSSCGGRSILQHPQQHHGAAQQPLVWPYQDLRWSFGPAPTQGGAGVPGQMHLSSQSRTEDAPFRQQGGSLGGQLM